VRDGVVSVRSFKMLEQWLYLGRAIFSELASEEAITSTIEFVRFVGMCGVTGLDTLMAERMKAIIIADPALPSEGTRDPDTNTCCLPLSILFQRHFYLMDIQYVVY
jgi:hypothetical protein